jgi:uncharacterized protein involved in tolerance to divalent cations
MEERILALFWWGGEVETSEDKMLSMQTEESISTKGIEYI